MRNVAIFAASLALMLAGGCFDEPLPAYKDASAGKRIYLSEMGLDDLAQHRAEFAEPASVDYVNLDRNNLKTFPEELLPLVNLKWLRLNENRLSDLPDLSAMAKLRRIYLRGNEFAAVPQTLEKLPSLTDIDLSENPLTEVPEWLAAKKDLENLSFTRTLIKKLPQDLSAWRCLLSLQLGDLELSPGEMSRIRAALPDTAIVF